MSRAQEAADWINARQMLVPMMPTTDMLARAYARITDEAINKFGLEAVKEAKPILEQYRKNRSGL